MARSDLDKEFRRINDRMQKLFETYGEDSPSYQMYANIIDQNFEYKVTDKGNMRIVTGKANADLNKFQRQALNGLLEGGETVGSLRAAAKQYMKEHHMAENKTKEEYNKIVDELVEKMDYVKNNKYIMSYISKQDKQGKPLTDTMAQLYDRIADRDGDVTYEELYELMKAAQGDVDKYLV